VGKQKRRLQGEITPGGLASCDDGGELRGKIGEDRVDGGGEVIRVEPGPEGGDVIDDGGTGDFGEEAVHGGDEEGGGGQGEVCEPARGDI